MQSLKTLACEQTLWSGKDKRKGKSQKKQDALGICGTGNGICCKNWTRNWALGKIWVGKWDLDPPPTSGPSSSTASKEKTVGQSRVDHAKKLICPFLWWTKTKLFFL